MDSARLLVTVNSMMAKYGAVSNYIRTSPSAPDPTKPWLAAMASGTGVTLYAVDINEGKSLRYFASLPGVQAQGENKGQRQALIAGDAFGTDEPEKDDIIIFPNSGAWSINGYDVVRPSDVPILFILDLAK